MIVQPEVEVLRFIGFCKPELIMYFSIKIPLLSAIGHQLIQH